MLRYLTFQECADIIPWKYNKHKIKLPQWQTREPWGKNSGYYLGAAKSQSCKWVCNSERFILACKTGNLSVARFNIYPSHLNCQETIRKLIAVNHHILKRIMCNRLNCQTIFDILLDYYQFTHYKTHNKYLERTLTIRNLKHCHTMYTCAALLYPHKKKYISLTVTNSSISKFEMYFCLR